MFFFLSTLSFGQNDVTVAKGTGWSGSDAKSLVAPMNLFQHSLLLGIYLYP